MKPNIVYTVVIKLGERIDKVDINYSMRSSGLGAFGNGSLQTKYLYD